MKARALTTAEAGELGRLVDMVTGAMIRRGSRADDEDIRQAVALSVMESYRRYGADRPLTKQMRPWYYRAAMLEVSLHLARERCPLSVSEHFAAVVARSVKKCPIRQEKRVNDDFEPGAISNYVPRALRDQYTPEIAVMVHDGRRAEKLGAIVQREIRRSGTTDRRRLRQRIGKISETGSGGRGRLVALDGLFSRLRSRPEVREIHALMRDLRAEVDRAAA